MDRTQRTTLLILSLLGLVYFALFFIPNSSTLGSDNPIVYLDRDEYVTYPVVERMLAFEGDIHKIWGSLIIYGDYHYGYPFYFFSMLVLLPFRLVQGSAFFENIPFNILLLRQFINVLPMVLTAGAFTYVQTHFKFIWKSLLVFVLLLSIPAVVRSNLRWWHPDSLTLLCIALTFLFLDLDEFRLEKFFHLGAVVCGLATAIKLMGFFFFLAIPLYLLIAWRKKNHSINKILSSAGLFLLIMGAVIVLTNPFLFYRAPREEMLAIQSLKSAELSGGYPHDESPYYAKGPQYWRWTLKVSYARPWALLIFTAALVIGCLRGTHRENSWLLAAWSIPLAIYLLWFVSPKPDHYMLPLLVPLYSAITSLIFPLEQAAQSHKRWLRDLAAAGGLLFFIFIAMQLHYHYLKAIPLFTVFQLE